jgi:acetoacetyl-CoA synthetase
LEQYFAESVPSIPPAHVVHDALAVGQSIQNGSDERVILFVKLGDGESLHEDLESAIRRQVRAKRSARHVPEMVSGIPRVADGRRIDSNMSVDHPGERHSLHPEREASRSSGEEGAL